MSAPRRWFRLDTVWSNSEWLCDLPPGSRLAWVLLLGFVKAEGTAGHAKAPPVRVAARVWDIPLKDVQAMLSAAHKDGALNGGEGEWRVTNWDKYQPLDATSAERKARQRKRAKESRDVTP